MSPRHHGYQSEPYDVVFAANHLAQGGFQFGRALRSAEQGFGGHWIDFTMHLDVILPAGTAAGYESHAVSFRVGRYPLNDQSRRLAEIVFGIGKSVLATE